jgi:SAM-dependent methyltransferase
VVDGIPILLPADYDQAQRRAYEASGVAAADEAAAVHYASARQHRLMIDTVRAVLDPLPDGARVLDVGCGVAAFTAPFAARCKVAGLDLALAMARTAQRKGLYAVQGDALNLPFADAQFDLVLCTEVLQIFGAAAPLVAELARACRPGGQIVVTTLNADSLVRRAYRLQRFVSPGMRARLAHTRMRRVEDLLSETRHLPLRAEEIIWTFYPVALRHRTGAHGAWFSPLASNFVMIWRKEGK